MFVAWAQNHLPSNVGKSDVGGQMVLLGTRVAVNEAAAPPLSSASAAIQGVDLFAIGPAQA